MAPVDSHVQCCLLLLVPGIQVHGVLSQDGDHFWLVPKSGMVDSTVSVLILQCQQSPKKQGQWVGGSTQKGKLHCHNHKLPTHLLLQVGVVPYKCSDHINMAVLSRSMESCLAVELVVHTTGLTVEQLLHSHHVSVGSTLYHVLHRIAGLVLLNHVTQ